MCFKTAGLPAPIEKQDTTFTTDNLSASVTYRASGTREVLIAFGGSTQGAASQFVEPADLRELADHFNELADKLEA